MKQQHRNFMRNDDLTDTPLPSEFFDAKVTLDGHEAIIQGRVLKFPVVACVSKECRYRGTHHAPYSHSAIETVITKSDGHFYT